MCFMFMSMDFHIGQKFVLMNEAAVVQLMVLRNTLTACEQMERWLMRGLMAT